MTDLSNPFIGPRSFRTGERLFGRDHEVAELLDLFIAERLVLLNSPSGAGKSSLLNAALVPRLRGDGFIVPAPMRVSQQLPPGTPVPPGTNRFALSLLLGMEEERPPAERVPLETLAAMTVDAYLDRVDREDDKTSLALIVDQFEEILTIDPVDRQAKAAFFDQLARALRPRDRWALFAMREEYVAALEPYARVLPTRLATRYRLDLLRPDQAIEAICKPIEEAGLEMAPEAAALMVRNLSLTRIEQPDGTTLEAPGHAVEPVQLQVVCRRLWASLPAGVVTVDISRVEQLGDIDRALAEYYQDVLAAAVAAGGASERAIREWIGRELITEQGLRGQVPQQPGRTRGLDNRAIAALVDGYLIRADKRRGITWYELAHDRLIDPVKSDNARWLDAHLHPLQRQAALWASQGRSPGLLLRADALSGAERWALENAEGLLDLEREFLADCIEARRLEERERLTARQLKRRGAAAAAAFVAALGLAVFAVMIWWRLVVAYFGIVGVTLSAFGWFTPTFDADDWKGALDANSALARAASGTTAAQRDATTIVLESAVDEKVGVGIALMLRQGGFQFVEEPPAASQVESSPPGVVGSVTRMIVGAGSTILDLASIGSDLADTVPRSRLAVRYGSNVDPDIVKVIVYTVMRARADVTAIEESRAPGDAGIVRIDAGAGDGAPIGLAAVEERLPSAPPDPIFAKVLDMEPLARSIGVATGRAEPTRIAFQQFEGNARMLWMQSDFDAHYVLEPPAPGERKGRWKWYSLADLPPDAVERVEAFLRDSPDPRRTRFQANGGFLQLWLHNGLEALVGWPVAGTCILGTSGGYVVQEFLRGRMLGPFPRYNAAERQYISGREFHQVHVLVLLDDYTYIERDVQDPDSDADKYTGLSRLGDSCNS